MSLDFPTVTIREGLAHLIVPDLDRRPGEPPDHARSRAPVFYNPVMRLNRDTAVLALQVHSDRLERPVNVCEPMCGSGVRGVRMALEAGDVYRILLGDLSPSAVKLSELNASRNSVQGKVNVRLMDANLMLNIHSHPMARFDYIDIDPYGSPSRFIDSAIRASHDGGMIALTATDMAPLCGVNPEACTRKYGGKPLRASYCHEVALRLLIGANARQAAIHEFGIKPVFGYYSDHYVRAYIVLERGARSANRSLQKMGYIQHCWNCMNRKTVTDISEIEDECGLCGEVMMVGGPLWLGDYADNAFCEQMLERFSMRGDWEDGLEQLLKKVVNEIGLPPTYYNADRLSSTLGVPSIPLNPLLEGLRAGGYRAIKTHFDSRGVKTDAPPDVLGNLFKE
ncbi:MAG: tRNA (guanine(10)-N(2))-dimethyltransferase [Candidatus Bathyarchaeia archaeon]